MRTPRPLAVRPPRRLQDPGPGRRVPAERPAAPGFTLMELSLALSVLAILLGVTTRVAQRRGEALIAVERSTPSDRLVRAMLSDIEALLGDTEATVTGETTAFHGNGAGFSFEGPRDRQGSPDRGQVAYRPVRSVTEVERGFDMNADGDMDDTFELGRLTATTSRTDVAEGEARTSDLGPPIFLQETGRPGADLDGDGLQDPMFHWDPVSGRLGVRLHALIQDKRGRDSVRRFETVLYLRKSLAR